MLIFPKRGAPLDDRIDATLAHAGAAPLYRRLWRRRSTSSTSSALSGDARLRVMPTLHKTVAAEHQAELVVASVRAQPAGLEGGVVSSSTTRSGRPLRILRSPDEHSPGAAAVGDAGFDGTLQLYSPKHGMREASTQRVMVPAVLHRNTIDVVIDVLQSHRPPIDTMVVPLSTLKWMTVAMMERGLDPASLGLTAIGTTGYCLTDAASRWLGDAWACPLVDNYSLSEVVGHASVCGACGDLHWQTDDVVVEVCDFDADVRTTKKIGELVLTTLVPAVLRMPLIRYRTGDVVEVRGPCAATGATRFRWRGRRSDSLIRDGVLVVGGRELLEFGEASADIAQHPHPAERLGLVPPSDLGVPKLIVDGDDLVAELRFDPARFPERAAQVAVALRGLCRGAGPGAIVLGRPGTLDVSARAAKL